MALVRAKRTVYLGEYGYRTEGEEFEYAGPKNQNLEAVKASKPEEAKAKPAEPESK